MDSLLFVSNIIVPQTIKGLRATNVIRTIDKPIPTTCTVYSMFTKHHTNLNYYVDNTYSLVYIDNTTTE